MNNDIVTKARLNAALGTEGNMGFEHNDIVTVDKMNEAIAAGGGGDDGAGAFQMNITGFNGQSSGNNPLFYTKITEIKIPDGITEIEGMNGFQSMKSVFFRAH